MSISQERMVQMVRDDVIDSIDDVGVAETAVVYDVEYDASESRNVFIDQCIASELNRCYA